MQKGWVAGLREGGLLVDNWSVGMSPSTRYAAYANRDLSSYDFVFFDAVPNDEVLEKDIGNELLNDVLLESIFTTISTQTRLIVLGFCWKQNFSQKSNAFMRHKRIAEKVGAQFVDIANLIYLFGKRYCIELDDLYENHHAHPQSLIAFEIGRSISLVFEDIDLEAWKVLGKSADRKILLRI